MNTNPQAEAPRRAVGAKTTKQHKAPARSEHADSGKDEGWYLYGVTSCDGAREAMAHQSGVPASWPLEVIEQGDLAAVVARVPLSEYTPNALETRLQDAAWLERMVRQHNQVVSAVHSHTPILPAKFGAVYARSEDLRQAVAAMHDAISDQLRRVTGCDEWAAHLYVAADVLNSGAGDAHVQELEREMASASPGKAYFLQRKLATERAKSAERTGRTASEEAHRELARFARATRIIAGLRPSAQTSGEFEVLHAAYLVPRTSRDAFLEAMRDHAAAREGMRWEYSGPLPPYSFAALGEESE